MKYTDKELIQLRNRQLRNKIDLRKLLRVLNIKFKETPKDLYAKCPLGHQRKRTSWSICYDKTSKNFGRFHCFSCGWKGNYITLIRQLLDLDKTEAIKYIRTLFNLGEIFEESLYKMALEEKKIIQEEKENYELVEVKLPEEFKLVSKNSGEFYDYLIDRDINFEMIKKYKMLYCIGAKKKEIKPYNNRVIVPITIDNKVVSFFARIIDKDYTGKQKGLYPPVSFPASHIRLVMFGIDDIDDSLDYGILVEGIFDNIRMQTLNYKNILSVLGNQLTKEKKEFLSKKFEGKDLYVIGDGDDGGKILIDHGKDLQFNCKVHSVYLPEDTDPGDISPSELRKAILRSKHKSKKIIISCDYTINKKRCKK